MTDLAVFTRGTGMLTGIDPPSNIALYDVLDAIDLRRFDGVEIIVPGA